MNFVRTTPEEAGISSKKVLDFLKMLNDAGFCTHSIIMARGEKIFCECYYEPFNKDFLHRMYSVSKSFVSIAVGMAIDDGLIGIDDKIADYFDEYVNADTSEGVRSLKIRDMLTMQTGMSDHIYWFTSGTQDRCKLYFNNYERTVSGTVFSYDSSASFLMGALVERVTGKPLLDYMRDKALRDIGFSEEAYCLKAPGGHSFGDSAVMCTAEDLLRFARFVMNKGEWNGKQYVSRDYMEAAVKKQVCNANSGFVDGYCGYGYGYQIWKAPDDGFAFVGMGDQFAICDPATDFIFIINSDNQGNGSTRPILYHSLYKEIVHKLGKPLAEDKAAYDELCDFLGSQKLFAFDKGVDTDFAEVINNKVYELEENPMGIEYIKLCFEGKKGELHYKNKQGEKTLVFGMGYNEFSKFPQEGYSDIVATEFEKGHYYDCACSAGWAEPKKLRIKVQIIDKYFGNGCFVFSFKDDRVSVLMTKTAENFMNEYNGAAIGKLKN